MKWHTPVVVIVAMAGLFACVQLDKARARENEANQRVQELRQELAETKKLVPPAPPHCVFDDAYAKLREGMTEDEALAAVKSCGVTEKPEQDFFRDAGNHLTGRGREIHWSMYVINGRDPHATTGKPNQDDWMMEFGLYFAGGRLYDANRRKWRSMEWEWTHPK